MRICLVLAIIALGLNPAAAANLSINDLVGHWCGGAQRLDYVFTRTQLNVIRYDGKENVHGPALQIEKIDEGPNRIRIYWSPFSASNSTSFELSGDKRKLIQLPQTSGDKGPRRIFTRC